MKVLIVKEDGLIYAAEVPEEPKVGNHSGDWAVAVAYSDLWRDYEKALAFALNPVNWLNMPVNSSRMYIDNL